MRWYSVATTALALGVGRKWLDNLLSQNRVEEVRQSRQGIQRRISPNALLIIDTVHGLNRDLHIPVATALVVAHQLWRGTADPAAPDAVTLTFGSVALHLSRREVRARVEAALAEALEMAPRTKRGRPRRKG